MLVVGLLLLAAAVTVGAAGVAANTGSEHQLPGGFTIFGYHLHGSAGRLYLAGLVIGAVVMLGFMMVADGLRRNAALRRELGRFRRDARARRRAEEAASGKLAPAGVAPASATAPSKAASSKAASSKSADSASQSAADTTAGSSAWRRRLRDWRTARPVS